MGIRSRRIVTSGAPRRKAGAIPSAAKCLAAFFLVRKMTHAIVNLLHRREITTAGPERYWRSAHMAHIGPVPDKRC